MPSFPSGRTLLAVIGISLSTLSCADTLTGELVEAGGTGTVTPPPETSPPEPTATPTPEPTPSPTQEPTPTPTPEPTPTPTQVPTPTPTQVPTLTQEPTSSTTPSPSPSVPPTPTDSPIPCSELDGDSDGFTPCGGDCNDQTDTIHPAAEETCDGRDENCNGWVDDSFTFTWWYQDEDSDGYGDPLELNFDCQGPDGMVDNAEDCDDGNATIHPNAAESCDGQDQNCDGEADEGVKITYYRDRDGDTYGDDTQTTQACIAPSGYVAQDGDCDDTTSSTYPGAAENCDNQVDDDCNGTINDLCRLQQPKRTRSIGR